MTWIQTVPLAEASAALRRALEAQRALYPREYETPVHPTPDGQASEIVASHSLIPEALHHAFATFGEADRGVLREGMLADIVVLDRDIRSVPAAEIRDAQVTATVVGGKVVYRR